MAQRLPSRRRTRRIAIVLAAIVLFFILSISTIVRLYTDLLWYREVHFTSVFFTMLRSETLLGIGLGAVFFLFCLANLFIVARLMPIYRLAVDPNDPLNRYRSAVLPYMGWIAAGGSAFLALLFGISAAPMWDRLVLALHSVPFHAKDAVFGRDVSFYVFRLPFYQFLYGWAFAALIVVTLVVAGAHYVTGGIRPQSPAERVTPQVKAHLSVLIGLIALLRAWGYRLGQYNLLYSTRGKISGASYTDLHAELPALRLLVVISIIGAILFLVNIRFRGWALPIAGAGLWFLTSVLAAGVYPFVVQRFVVGPAQLQKETPYIQRNINATRQAYGLDVTAQPYADTGTITPDAVARQAPVLSNIRLWDPVTLETAYQTLQEIRPYYSFVDVNPDRYMINGSVQQVLASARELNTSNLPAQNWQNQHLIYTHGYGVVVSPANQKTPEGQPQFLVQDIPPTSTVAPLQVNQPDLYFGESQFGVYSLVDSNQPELDFSSPTKDVYANYQGKGGVPVAGLFQRLMFAWRFKNINILISSLVSKDTKILYYRQIQERLLKAAPFLNWDTDPYISVVDGRQVWIADGYTVSDMYPYSEQTDFSDRTTRQTGFGPVTGIGGSNNYIRNSVKATIDAYDGTVKLYVWDPSDPVIQAWSKAFPNVFTDAGAMPQSIRDHVRYPEDLFSVQTSLYERYHVTDPRTFFASGDTWSIPPDPNQPNVQAPSNHAQEIQPYYVLMLLPGESEPSYDLILPMNPSGKQNMISLIAARSSPNVGGQELIDLHFPPGALVDGVGQVHARINANRDISTAKTLLGQQGSTVSFGNFLVVPLADSLIYVEPMFVLAQSNAVPLLEYVITATSTRVAFSTTLQDSLNLLVSGQTVGTTPTGTVTTTPPASGGGGATGGGGVGGVGAQTLAQQVLQHFQAAQAAAAKGDFATEGQELAAAQALLQQAASPGASPPGSASGAPSPSPSPSKS
jgi:uncharacterized membrane protein (UPF0182 family)